MLKKKTSAKVTKKTVWIEVLGRKAILIYIDFSNSCIYTCIYVCNSCIYTCKFIYTKIENICSVAFPNQTNF